MRKFVLALAVLCLVSCSYLTGDPVADAAKTQAALAAFAPLSSQIACAAQKAANDAGAIAELNGDVQGAHDASLASASAGIGCGVPGVVTVTVAPK